MATRVISKAEAIKALTGDATGTAKLTLEATSARYFSAAKGVVELTLPEPQIRRDIDEHLLGSYVEGSRTDSYESAPTAENFLLGRVNKADGKVSVYFSASPELISLMAEMRLVNKDNVNKQLNALPRVPDANRGA